MTRSGRRVIRSGEVIEERKGNVYTAHYQLFSDRVLQMDETGSEAELHSDFDPDKLARILLTEDIDSGEMDRRHLGRPKI